MKDIETAIELLQNNNLTLVIIKDGNVLFTSKDKGIKPLFTAVRDLKKELIDSSVADRVTGKAAAMLCSYAGIKQLKTGLLSDNAVNVLKDAKIIYEFDKHTPFIENRDKSGMCPVETLAVKVSNIEELIKGIENFLRSINNLD